MTPADWLYLVSHQQPGCSREWNWGTLLVRLHHAETGGWEVSLVAHPDGTQWVSRGWNAQEAARHLANLTIVHPLVDIVRPTPDRSTDARS